VRSRHGTQEYGELEAERDELRDELEKAKARIAELEALLPSAEIIPLKQDAE
jgi:transcription elongation GreA/GreB family factor